MPEVLPRELQRKLLRNAGKTQMFDHYKGAGLIRKAMQDPKMEESPFNNAPELGLEVLAYLVWKWRNEVGGDPEVDEAYRPIHLPEQYREKLRVPDHWVNRMLELLDDGERTGLTYREHLEEHGLVTEDERKDPYRTIDLDNLP